MLLSETVPDTTAVNSGPIIAAQALAALIQKYREALAIGPDLPIAVADGLKEAGLTQLWLPRTLGGLELDPLEFVQVIETLAKLDGAVAWSAMISSAASRFAGMIELEPLRSLIPSGKMHAFSGSGHPTGTITRNGNGWRIDGRWSLNSFSRFSTVTVLVCVEHEDGIASVDVNGGPKLRAALVPSSKVQVLGNWKGDGLRASGSHDIVCSSLLVPDEHTTTMDMPRRQSGPLYNLPMTSALAIAIVGLPLGIAAAAIDALISLAQTKIPFFSALPLREQEHVQLEVAWAKTHLLAARAFVFQVVGELWAAASSGKAASIEHQALLRMACCNAGVVGKQVVERMYKAAGTNSILEDAPFAAQLRDIFAACQQINFADRLMIPPGRILLRLDAGTPML